MKDHVEALRAGRFDPSKIDSITDLISLYQGKTLIEHVAEYYTDYETQRKHYVEEMNACFQKFVEFIIPKLDSGLGSPYLKDLRIQFIIFLSYLGRRESTAEIQRLEANPKAFFPWLKTLRKNLSDAQKKEFNFENFQKILREVTLMNQIVNVAKGCNSLSDLERKNSEIEALSNDTLFTTHRNYSGWSLNFLAQVLRSAKIEVPDYPTHTSSNLSKVSQCMESGGDNYLVKYLAFLMKFYKAFECRLQGEIARYLETIITVSVDKPDYRRNLTRVMIEHFISGEIGRESAEPLLARLSEQVNALLLEFLAKDKISSSQYDRFNSKFIAPLVSHQPNLELDFKLDEADRETEIYLLLVIAAGNFPKIKWINLTLNQEGCASELMQLRRFFSNPKVVLRNSNRPSLDFVEAFRFASVYSPYPPLCFVAFEGIEAQVNVLIKTCLTYGIPQLRFLSNGLSPQALENNLAYLKQSLFSDSNFSIYHRIDLSTNQSFDLTLTANGLNPGPISKSNSIAKDHYDRLMMALSSASQTPLLHKACFIEKGESSQSGAQESSRLLLTMSDSLNCN